MKNSILIIIPLMLLFQMTHAQIEFQSQAIPNTGCNYKVAPSDIDGDGDMDYFALCYSSVANLNHVTWYENSNGLGNFVIKDLMLTNNEVPTRLYPCDIDGDGDQDLLTGSRGQDGINRKIFWYENVDGQGNFGERQIIDVSAETAWSMEASDMDGDGDLDVIAAINEERIVWFKNIDGQGNFGEAETIVTLISDVYDIHVSDLDNDGDMDVLAAFTDVIKPTSNNNRIVWYENINGEGIFGEEKTVSLDVNVPSALNSADFDGDGDMDIITCTLRGGRIIWYENTNGQGDFSVEHLILVGDLGLSDLALVDLDKDGDIDVLSTTREWETSTDNKVAWYENIDGLGDFGDQQVFSTDLSIPASIGVADFDGDSDIDVICKSGSYSGNEAITYWFENLSPVGIDEYTLTDFTIYPSPAKNFINIKSENEIESLEIYNAIGQLVKTELYPTKVDISSLAKGSYFCLVKDTDNNFGIEKIIKLAK